MKKFGIKILASVIFIVASILIIASCATAPKGFPPHLLPEIKTIIPESTPSRGALISAVSLGPEQVRPVLRMLKPGLLSTRINVKPLQEAGFFRKLDSIKPKLSSLMRIRLQYWSADSAGRPVKQSGLLVIPAPVQKQLPLLLICHGTQIIRERVPSRLGGSELPLAVLAASSGVAVVLPDYPGMGDGEGFHTYCHAESLANSGVDILRAARNWFDSSEAGAPFQLGEDLYVGGYSEGGLAAMAVLKQLQTEASDEFSVTACFPLAGPFDMSGSMRRIMIQEEPISSPYYLPYTILGWAGIYQGLKPTEAIRPEYIEALMPIFDGRSSAGAINKKIAALQGVPVEKAVASLILTDLYRDALINPEGSALGRTLLSALKENDLYDWPCRPGTVIHFMAADKDELVPFENSVKAYEAMSKRGAAASFRQLDQSTHENGAYEGYGIMLLEIWKAIGL